MRSPIQAARRLTSMCLVLVLAGCGNAELDTLEKEQAELRTKVDELKTNVGVLRTGMVEAGLISAKQAKLRSGVEEAPAEEGKAGKARRKPEGRTFGHPLPENELGEALPVTATRTGTPPELPALTDLERNESACGHKFVMRDLQPLSDYPLNSAGLGKSGPIVMLENGEPMAAHAAPEAFDETCSGAFRHAGYAFLFSPSGEVEAAAKNTYTLAHSDDVPMPRGDDGRPMYWVYPGTTLELAIDGGWDESWGDMILSIGGRVVVPSELAPQVRVAGQEMEIPPGTRPNGFAIEETLAAPPSGPWRIEIESPEGGPYLVLGTITVGNADNALVITSEEAFAAAGDL